MLSEEETIQIVNSISQENFQKISSELLEKMGFDIFSMETRDDSILVEGDIERGGKKRDYLIKCSRSEENLKEEIKELHELLGGKKYGLFLTTRLKDRKVEKTEKIEFVGGTPFYKLLKKFDMLSQIEKYGERLREEEETERSDDRKTSPDKSEIEEWGKKGKNLYQAGRYQEAIKFFEKVLERNPEDHVALNNKALCHIKENEYEKALESINEAISINSNFEDAYLNKAFILEKRGELDKAKETAKELVDLKPDKGNYHYIYAAYLRKTGELKEAWAATEKTLEVEPGHEEVKKLRSSLRKELTDEIAEEPEELEKEGLEEAGDSKREFEGLKRENEELKERLEERESKISDLQEEIEDLESELSEIQEEKKKVENKFKMEKNRLRNSLKLKQERVDKLQEKRDELKETLEEIREDETEVEESTQEDTENKEKAVEELQTLKYVGPELAERIYDSGYKSVDDLKEASKGELSEIKGMGSAITEKVIEYLQEE